MKWIEFILKDWSKEYYDPLIDFSENELSYEIYNWYYKYTILKENVVSYKIYNLCKICERWLDEKWDCRYCEF